MTDERRQHSRIAFHAPARLVVSARPVDCVVLDLSLKGALIQLPADAAIEGGTTCSIEVMLNEAEDTIEMTGRVTHCAGRHVGIRCENIDLDSVTHLRRLVELNLGDPALLERELSALIAD